MKKILTSLTILAAALAASAQNFTVTTTDDATISNGDVINIGYIDGARPGTYTWDPELIVHIEKAGGLTVTANASIASFVQFCGLDGACQMLVSSPFSKSKTYGAGDICPLEIDAINKRDLPAEPIVTNVTVSSGSQTVSFTLNFIGEPKAGIQSATVDPNKISVAHRVLTYNVDSPSQLAVYNISGRAVINRRINSTGSLNLAALPAGVYVYRLGSSTGKFLLR